MPDGSMTNLANARNSNVRPNTTESDVAGFVSHQIWERAEKIDRELFQTKIAFDIVFGILEEASSAALSVDADPAKEAWQIKYLLSYIDQLYYLLGDINRRCTLIKKAEERILELSSKSAEPDPVEALAEACLRSEETYDVPRPSSTGEEEKRLEEAMAEAAERLTAHRTTTPFGILRKLEYAARVEDFERDLQDNPNLAVARIVMGLINDLKQSLDLK